MIVRNRSVSVQKKISLGGILSALIVISLMAAAWLPTNKFFFLAVSSLFVSIIIIRVDLINALMVFITTSILAFFIIPYKSIFIAYFIFFGLYGVVKFLCEQLNNPVMRWITKLIAFNISLCTGYFLINTMLTNAISYRLPLEVLWLIAQIVFILYDILYTLFIAFYHEKLEKALNKIFK